MAIFLDCPRLHQLAVTTLLQVDQTCTVGSIFAHIFIRRSFNILNQSDTSVMDAIGKRSKGIVPYCGVTQQWTFDILSLDAPFQLNIWFCLLRRHQYWGWGWDKSQIFLPNRGWDESQIPLPNRNWDKYQLTLPNWYWDKYQLNLTNQERGFIPSSYHLPIEHQVRVVLPYTPHIASEGFSSHLLSI